jgi:arsenate reductase
MPGELEKLNVLFVCTGNTCRSQMAEGLLRKRAGEYLNAFSAGSDAGERVNPYAIKVMDEIGINLDGHYPKDIDVFLGKTTLHYVIIVCDSAARKCPRIWPGALNRIAWPFKDPSEFVGATEEETLAKYREVRDLIAARIDEWLADANGPLERFKL